MHADRGWTRWAALALFVVLALVHTWPIASDPGRLGRNSQDDTKLNAWVMAWVAHQVVRDPGHLFDAPIFYPERHTLAFSEPLVVQALMGAPAAWAGGSPIFVYNLVLIAGFALTGWTTSMVIQRWTGSWLAGLIYDHFGYYLPAFATGVVFNVVNLAIVGFLVVRLSNVRRQGLYPATG